MTDKGLFPLYTHHPPAIKTGRYTSTKRTQDILEVKRLQESNLLQNSASAPSISPSQPKTAASDSTPPSATAAAAASFPPNLAYLVCTPNLGNEFTNTKV